MIVVLPADANQLLADRARVELCRHLPRTPGRAAAAQLHIALATTKTIDGARKAIRGFGTEQTQDAALCLLHRLAVALADDSPRENREGD